MRIDSAFPSKHLKSSDLNGQRVAVRMNYVEMQKVGDDNKPVLYFQGKEKGMVLNKTNSNTIAAAYGNDTDQWAGHAIEIFEADVEFQGKMTKGLRVSIPRRHGTQAPLNTPPQQHDEMNPPPQQGNGYAAARNGQAFDKRMDQEVPF